MSQNFAYKAGFLQPVDWWPREFNQAADLVADHVLDKKCDVNNFNSQHIGRSVNQYFALQFFCDGGYSGSEGSMAVVLVGWRSAGGDLVREILGYEGICVIDSLSSFGCEIGALDMATRMAECLTDWLPCKDRDIELNTKRRRVR